MSEAFGLPPAPGEAAVWRPVAKRPRPGRAVLLAESLTALICAAVVTALGAPLGLIWAAWRPHFDAAAALLAGDDAAFETTFGADLRFGVVVLAGGAVLGVVAGALSVRRGAGHRWGVVAGLTVGGLLGALVAAHVGELAAHPDALRSTIDATLRSLPPHQPLRAYPSDSQELFVTTQWFHLRSWPIGALLPFASLATFSAAAALGGRRRSWTTR